MDFPLSERERNVSDPDPDNSCIDKEERIHVESQPNNSWLRTRVVGILIACGIVILSLLVWISTRHSTQEPFEQKNEPAIEFSDITTSNVLQYYLGINDEAADEWITSESGLVSRTPETGFDFDNKPVTLLQSLGVVASGSRKIDAITRRVFLIQYASMQPHADFPVSDSYSCGVLVGTVSRKGWQLENMDFFEESNYEGGTRWAKNCSGFKIAWQGGFPVLRREKTVGPYAGGNYATILQTVHRTKTKYELTNKEIATSELQ